MDHLPSSQESTDSFVPSTPLPTLPSRFFSQEEIPETPDISLTNSPKNNTVEQPVISDTNLLCLAKTCDDLSSSLQTKHSTENDDLQHSENAAKYLGKRTPRNTVRANMSALRAFCRFVTGDRSLSLEDKNTTNTTHPAFNRTKTTVFSDPDGGCLPFGFTDWSDQQLKRIRFYLIEFVVNYKAVKTGVDVKPSTMRGYITSLQRAFLFEWGYGLRFFEGPVFNCPKKGLIPVIDNKFSEQQSEGNVVKSHNTLSKEDLRLLFSSSLLSRETPDGYQARLIFGMGLITAMRPTALSSLTLRQVRKITVQGEQVWSVSGVIGSRVGASKTELGGLAAVRDRPTEVCIWNRVAFDGSVNFFKDVDDYMVIRRAMECNTDRFFLGINRNGTDLNSFFRIQPLGRNSFGRIIKSVCKKLNIVGSGLGDCVTAHGLRGTVVTLLFEANMADATVAMRTGHRDMRSLKSYHNLRGNLGRAQQAAIFNEPSKKRKTNDFDNDEKENFLSTKDAVNLDKKECKVPASLRENEEAAPHTVSNGNEDEGGKGNDAKGRADSLLSGISAISGGTFTFHVHNHYR